MPELFEEIFSKENLLKAYHKALVAQGKYHKEALVFARNETYYLRRLREVLYDKTYVFSGYNKFSVYEPKERVIYAPHFVDKIVQLAIHFVLTPLYLKSFIKSSYSCLPGRGTLAAVNQVQSNLFSARSGWGKEAYILKLDVKKFFYSINRDLLKQIYRQKIKDEDVLWVLDTITDSASSIDAKGLPLGNTTSQLFSNIYMDRLDQACVRWWGYKYYVRYADDIIVVLPNKAEAVLAKERCTTFLHDKLDLEINRDKTQVFPLKNGVNAFGYKIRPDYRLLRTDSKQRIKRKVKAIPHLIQEGRLTELKAGEMLASWSGHACNGNCYHFIQNLVIRYPYLYLDKKGILRLDATKVK